LPVSLYLDNFRYKGVVFLNKKSALTTGTWTSRQAINLPYIDFHAVLLRCEDFLRDPVRDQQDKEI